MAQAGAVLSMDGRTARYFGRPVFTRWVVPVDSETTRVIAWANYGERSDAARKEWMTPQTIEIIEGGEPRTRSLDEAIRKPGDYEAFVGQGRITRHAKENLATSDAGVAMFRKRLLTDIRAHANGKLPYQLSENVATPIPTYAGDNVLEIPIKQGMDDDTLLLEVSRQVAQSLTSGDECTRETRDEIVANGIKAIEKMSF